MWTLISLKPVSMHYQICYKIGLHDKECAIFFYRKQSTLVLFGGNFRTEKSKSRWVGMILYVFFFFCFFFFFFLMFFFFLF